MKKEKLFLSSIAPSVGALARKYGLGVELADFCIVSNLDGRRKNADNMVNGKLWGVRRNILQGPFNELFPCAIDLRARELARYRYIQTLKAAKEYQSERIVLHSGYAPQVYYDCWFVEKSAEFWQEFFRSFPIEKTICLENVLETRPEPLLQVLEAVNNPRLRVCLDVGHIGAYSQVPVMTWLETLAPWISHVHLHNNQGQVDSHDALYEGVVPMEEFLRSAGEIIPETTYTLELTDPEPSVQWLLEKGLLE